MVNGKIYYIKRYILTILISFIFSGLGGIAGWTWATRGEYVTKSEVRGFVTRAEAGEMITLRFQSLKDYLSFFEDRLSKKLSGIDASITSLDERREKRLNTLEDKIETKLDRLEDLLKKKSQ